MRKYNNCSKEYNTSVTESKTRAFELVGDQVAICQLAAFMEIVHPLFGWVKSGAMQTAIQVHVISVPFIH